MEHPRLPIEIWEHIMEALQWYHQGIIYAYSDAVAAQATVRACALTCRAWRPRAQFYLWRHPSITHEKCAVAFTVILRCISPWFAGHVCTLDLNFAFWSSGPHLPHLGDLFLLSLPNLRRLVIRNLRSDAIRVPPWLRTQLTLCAPIINLELTSCMFDTARTMFHIIWSSPHLRTLGIQGCRYRQAPLQEEQARLTQAARNLKVCRNLTSLRIGAVSAQPLSSSGVFASLNHPVVI
ncbi:hypothetical protein BV20DRAFT_818576 [Pilatotrama ljubarskyi]|nr:hypothetical protein BV20DRAFT_818576 [Pilatotrama ljubarskyi]